MGLLRKNILLFTAAVLISGCGKSLIEISTKLDDNSYPMFGMIPSRNFYIPVTVTDSLKLKWESSGHGGYANTSVTIYDEYVFTSDLSGRIFVYNITDGDQVGMLKSKGAIYTSPLVYRSKVIYGVAKQNYDLTELIYYDYRKGKELVNEEIYGRLLSEMIGLEDGIIFLTENGRVNRYDLFGSLIWKTETGITAHCSPSLKNGVIIFGNDNGEIIGVNKDDGGIIYRKQYDGIFTGTPAIDDSMAYLGNNNGNIYAVELENGNKIWQFDTDFRVLMSPAFDNKNIFVGNLSGDLFSLNKYNGRLKWKKHFKGLFNSTPLLTENRIIISNLFLSFYIIDKSNGELKKSFILEGRAKLSPVYFKGLLFIGFDTGVLRAYEFIY